jgi:hypothetical protein
MGGVVFAAGSVAPRIEALPRASLETVRDGDEAEPEPSAEARDARRRTRS